MNWDKIEQLLHIGSMTAEHGPRYAPITAAAQLELEQHLAEAVKAIVDKKKADIAAAQKAEAEAEKAATAEADKAKADAAAKVRLEEAQKRDTPRPFTPAPVDDADPSFRRI